MIPPDAPSDATIRSILESVRHVALVGASDREDRASHGVMRFWLDRGVPVTPVNPVLAGRTIHGQTVVPTLADAGPLDLVDLFRASAHVPPEVDEAIRLGARTVWMQLGVRHEEAAARARAAGLAVVMDRCPAIEWPRLGVRRPA